MEGVGPGCGVDVIPEFDPQPQPISKPIIDAPSEISEVERSGPEPEAVAAGYKWIDFPGAITEVIRTIYRKDPDRAPVVVPQTQGADFG